jgi:hypothetical protein
LYYRLYKQAARTYALPGWVNVHIMQPILEPVVTAGSTNRLPERVQHATRTAGWVLAAATKHAIGHPTEDMSVYYATGYTTCCIL